MSCTIFAQQLDSAVTDSSNKPVFYGIINGQQCYCFSYEQTKGLMQDAVVAIQTDSLINAYEAESVSCDSAISFLEKRLHTEEKLKDALSRSNQTVTEMKVNVEAERDVLKVDNAQLLEKITKLKFQRILYPAVTAFGILLIFILAK